MQDLTHDINTDHGRMMSASATTRSHVDKHRPWQNDECKCHHSQSSRQTQTMAE